VYAKVHLGRSPFLCPSRSFGRDGAKAYRSNATLGGVLKKESLDQLLKKGK